MLCSDCAALVFKDKTRRADREDSQTFDESIGSEFLDTKHSGVLGSGDIRVVCYCEGFPKLVKRSGNSYDIYNVCDIVHNPSLGSDGKLEFEFFGCKISYTYDSSAEWYQYTVKMIEPDGKVWDCIYGRQDV